MEDFNCLECSACCFSDQKYYILISFEEREKYKDFSLITLSNLNFIEMKNGKCPALLLKDDKYYCSIYENRPEVCRKFERGSGCCRTSRNQNLVQIQLRKDAISE